MHIMKQTSKSPREIRTFGEKKTQGLLEQSHVAAFSPNGKTTLFGAPITTVKMCQKSYLFETKAEIQKTSNSESLLLMAVLENHLSFRKKRAGTSSLLQFPVSFPLFSFNL